LPSPDVRDVSPALAMPVPSGSGMPSWAGDKWFPALCTSATTSPPSAVR
jgi:hypothetical protein